MADLSDLNSALATKLTGADSSGLETNFVNSDSNGNLQVIDYADGPVSAGTAASKSTLVGVVFNTSLPTLTNGQQAAAQADSSARLIIAPLTNTSIVKAQLQDNAGTAVTLGQKVMASSLPITIASDQSALAVSQSGTWTVQPGNTANTTPWLVTDSSDGSVTPGTVAAKSSLAGGQFNTSLPTLTNGQQAALQVDASGRLIVTSSGTTVGVSDKTAFTYGTTVQQTIGGVFQDTSPTLTAGTQGALRLNANRALHSTLRDPATDVGITSDNNGNANNQRLHMATPDTSTVSTALGALNATIVISLAGLASAGMQLAAGTLVGTLVLECSLDGGVSYPGVGTFYDPANSTSSTSIVFGSANTAKTVNLLPVGGSSHVRVRVSAYTSGTANAILRASMVQGAAGAITAAAYGTITNTFVGTGANTATLMLAANSNRKYAYFSNGSGTQVNIQFGSTTGLSTTTGIPIPAKSFYELKGDNLFTGNVYAFAASNVTLSVSEGTP